MKKTLFSTILFIIFLFSASAQDDLYVIEQAFPVAIRQLTVVEGWTLRLVHTPGEDSTRVAVVTPCPYYFAEGKEPTVIALDGDKLHILPNRTMPPGTTVEVRDPEPLEVVMEFNDCKWELVNVRTQEEIAAANTPEVMHKLVDFIRERRFWRGSATELLEELGDQSVGANVITKYVNQYKGSLLL